MSEVKEVKPELHQAASESSGDAPRAEPLPPKAESAPVQSLPEAFPAAADSPPASTPAQDPPIIDAPPEAPALAPSTEPAATVTGPSEPTPTAPPSDPAPASPPPAAAPASPPAAAAADAASERTGESGADDSGCDTEPEPTPGPPGSMEERRGPAMADVEQLARSVVTDTIERAKSDAKLQRELDSRRRDPDSDDDGWLDIVGNGQLKKKVLTPGSGDRESRPKRSQVVTVELSARLADGRETGAVPARLTFGLGDGEVVTGLDMAVGLMQPGETADVFMEPRFAYGEHGLEEGVPPNASLTFTVRLVDVQPEPKYEEMSAQERLEVGNAKRDRGNWWFKRDDFNHAIQCYRRALDFFDNESDEFTGLPDDVHVLFEERLKVHNNMAAAQMKLEAFDAALRSVQVVLSCQPHNVKALYRKGKILIAQSKLPEAAEALALALEHSPDNRTVQAELSRLQARQRKLAEEQKSLYRKMLGLPPAEPKPAVTVAPGKSVPVKLLACGVACALAAIAVSKLNLF